MKKLYEQIWNYIRNFMIIITIFVIVIILILGYELNKLSKENKKLKNKNPEIIIEEKIIEKNISPIPYDDLGIYTISHYCDCSICTGTQKGSRTASGIMPKEGRTIACDGKILKIGDIVYIEGYGVYECQDLGGKIKQNKIDIYCNSHNEALKKGIKKARVYKIGE